MLQNFGSILTILFVIYYCNFSGFRKCLAEYTVHNLSPCYGLLTALVLLNSVARFFFAKKILPIFCKNGVILHTCAWASERYFPGGPLVDFFRSFPRKAKSGEICFLPHENKKTAFFAEIFNSCPIPTRPVTSLGHQGRWRVFWEGPKFFKPCPVVLNYVQHIFLGGFAPPGYGLVGNCLKSGDPAIFTL